MSGSGGGGGGGETVTNCAAISFNTDINSPQGPVLEGLETQDNLNVELDNNTVVVVRQDTGDTLGSINWSSIAKLIECLREGFEYAATVRDIQDGLIKVHISAK
ncbi:MAG: hypothetical protein KZQ96_13750 [Candidatus Thiodiazotropha sp. (ex Lucinoma borealis)]|nr:hypothetical protein [Candidatus Thiodiazotropha sp. (ex Lucinoma borealis)]